MRKLLRDKDLTLNKATEMCQLYEQNDQHTKALATPKQTAAKVDSLHNKIRKRQPQQLKTKTGTEQRAKLSEQRPTCLINNCNDCEGSHDTKIEKCPAYGQQCHKCKKWNRFHKCSKSSQASGFKKESGNHIEMQAASSDEEMFFVDGVDINTVDSCFLHRNEIFTIELKVDTGAKCNIMSTDLYAQLRQKERLQP